MLILIEGQEHHLLKWCQFSFGTNQGFNGKLCNIECVENGSKNCSSSYKDNVDNNKEVKQYAGMSLGMKRYHSIIKEYFSKIFLIMFLLSYLFQDAQEPQQPMVHTYACRAQHLKYYGVYNASFHWHFW